LVKAQFARAVDAGSLAGARSLRLGQAAARERAMSIAALNGVEDGRDGVSLNMVFGVNEDGEQTVRLDASREVPTLLMRILGIEDVTVQAGAVAAVPPVDLSLVLDQSGSLGRALAWDDLQLAARSFVDHFDDNIDQLGLLSFQLRGTERFPLAGGFKNAIKVKIGQMRSNGDTNVGEGLRLAHEQLTGITARDRSAKVVVFFTDGRPTAFRGFINGRDRMLAVYTTGTSVRGYFNRPNRLPTDDVARASGCRGRRSCFGWTEADIRAQARQLGLDRASQIREAGIFVYSIGLGNPNATNELETPDMEYLKLIANEKGVANPNQPAGKAYFAPSAAQLREVFEQVASDLLVRLAQ
ncbi:MAG: VWA domain-containing protein, partial [Gemmatimonadota bacterium]